MKTEELRKEELEERIDHKNSSNIQAYLDRENASKYYAERGVVCEAN